MKTNYEISVNYNDLHTNESLEQIIGNLEQLEKISNDVFERINKTILEKKTKMENLKSRINRVSSIIASFETLPKALTLKSQRFYPGNRVDRIEGKENPGIHKTIYYDDVCDFKLLSITPPALKQKKQINTKVSNTSADLGRHPNGSLDDVTLTQELLNTMEVFKDLQSELNFDTGKTLNKNAVPPNVERFNSLFQFFDKIKVYGEKIQTQDTSVRESNLLSNFMKKSKKNRKRPDEAPVSITEKARIVNYKKKKDLIRRNTSIDPIQFQIPQNMNLGNIADIDVETTPIEDYFAEDNRSEVDPPQEKIISDDLDDFQMPLEKIKNYNTKHANVRDKGISYGADNINTKSQKSNKEEIPIQSRNKSENIPQVPKAPTSNNISKEAAQSNQSSGSQPLQVPKPPNIPLPPKIPQVKKSDQNQIKEHKSQPQQQKKEPPKQVSLNNIEAEITSFNKNSLKSVGSITLGQKNKDEKPKAPSQSSLLNQLKDQIRLRYKNLNMNNKPVKTIEEDSFEEPDDDSI